MITTRNGDDCYTDIKNLRVKKDDEIIEILGCIDETMAVIMLADNYSHLTYIEEIITYLTKLAGLISGYNQQFETTELINNLEKFIFSFEDKFSFNFPIREEKKLHINLARTKVRQLERKLCSFPINNSYKIVINRISDYLYVEQLKCK